MHQITDHALETFIAQYVRDYDPASATISLPSRLTQLDVRLGPVLYREKPKSADARHQAHPRFWSNLWTQQYHDPHESIVIEPGHFILAETIEHFTLPNTVKGLFTLRSWAAKTGLDQAASITLKPNWSGNLIMELRNNLRHTALVVRIGDAIGQVEFFYLPHQPEPFTP